MLLKEKEDELHRVSRTLSCFGDLADSRPLPFSLPNIYF